MDLSCDCAPGDAPIHAYVWDLGSTIQVCSTLTHTFSPGRYNVRLTVVDTSGLTAQDEVEIVVSELPHHPPVCRAMATASEGFVPLSTLLRSTFSQPDGRIVSATWTLWEGRTLDATEVPFELLNSGQYTARLRVVDEWGLTCTDSVTLVAFGSGDSVVSERVPPRILHVPDVRAGCGLPATYENGEGPLVSGTGPFSFSAEPFEGERLPEGLSVDPATGDIQWTPGDRPHDAVRFRLRVEGPGGFDLQPIDVLVDCRGSMSLAVGFGCSANGGMTTGWIGLFSLLIFAASRRRRAR